MNPKLGIVIMHFTNLPQARKFYAETVGLPVIDAQSDDHFVTLQAGDSLIGLSGEPGSFPAGSTEIGIEVNDADRAYSEWKSQGATLLSEPNDFPFGRSFDAQDPEGHRINIYKLRSSN